jgi:arylsulfatase
MICCTSALILAMTAAGFRRVYLLVPAQTIVGEFLETSKEFPPRQKWASFSLDQVIEKMTEASKAA